MPPPVIALPSDGDAPESVAMLKASAYLRSTPCGDGSVVWRIWGQGPALVLFHGAFGSWTHWVKSIAALAESHQVIVPDIPGFGDSALPPQPYTGDSIARILCDGLVQLLPANAPITFTGFSFGGQMAARCARLLRERTRQIVLISSSNLGVPRTKVQTMQSWRRLDSRSQRDAVHRHNLQVMMIYDPMKIDADAVWIQRNNAERARLRDLPMEPMRLALEEAGRPIAFICGDQDPRCGSSLHLISDALKAIDPDARITVLPGYGHWLSYEAPDELNAALRAVLATPTKGF